jgi:ubiquinone/menaquinone biosynthesis C-methylase UbiE
VSGVVVHAAAEGLGAVLGDADRVVVVGGPDAVVAAAEAVGMAGRVTGVGLDGADREAAERRRRRAGFYQVAFADGRAEALPAADGSLDAVVAAPPVALSCRRGGFLCEVARVLAPGGRLVVLGGPA